MNLLRHGKIVLILMLTSLNILIPDLNLALSQQAMTDVAASDDLLKKLQVVLEDDRLNGAITGVSIREAKTGLEIFSHDSDLRLHPASNMKLITGAVALEILGEDYQFVTELWTDGSIKDKVLHGNLYLKGKGDPTFSEKDLEEFALYIRKLGIEKVTGDLIADDSWYDDIRLSMDLNWNDESYHTGAQVSALTLSPNDDYDTGTIQLEVHAGKKLDEPAVISVTPQTEYIKVINQTKMTVSQELPTISVERKHGENEIIVEGTLPLGVESIKKHIAVWEPTVYVLSIFKQKLKEQEIAISGRMRVAETPSETELLTKKSSVSLKEILIPFMKLSNNGIGEMLIKEIGRYVYDEGSWEKGLTAVHNKLIDFGLDGQTILLRDGSGMSHKTMIPASELSKMLYAIQENSWFPAFKNTLPIAGNPDYLEGGTLRYRLTDSSTEGKVHAKTGMINGVSTLSGYLISASGDELIFSIMINNHLSKTIREIEDMIVTIMATN